jgi:hypothetical protein
MERSSLDVFYPRILPRAPYTFQSSGLISARAPRACSALATAKSAAGRLPRRAAAGIDAEPAAAARARIGPTADSGGGPPPPQIAALNTLKRHHPG